MRVVPFSSLSTLTGWLRLLEVGALEPDNYTSCRSWLDVTPIDLRSRHPDIKEQDFLLLDPDENKEKWDAISLSLVVNFVPDAKDRGTWVHVSLIRACKACCAQDGC